MLAVEFHAAKSSSGPRPSPRPAPSYQLRSGAGVERRQLEMVWGSSGSAAGSTPAAALMCFSAADSGAANDITGQIGAATFFFWKGGGGGCKTSLFPVTGRSEPLWYPSSSPTFNSTPRCFEHIDLSGIHFLACWVSIWKWFWHDLYPHFPILLRWWGGFLSLWPNKSDSCKRGEKKKKEWDLKFPSSLSGGAQLQCILFSIRVVQLQSWELQVERRAERRQKWLIFIGT